MDKIYDVIIVGGGPGGLTAALYSSRSNLNTLILEAGLPGGQLNNTETIENYTGFESIAGYDLAQKMHQSASQFGADLVHEAVIEVKNQEGWKDVITSQATYRARAVIIATGATHKTLGIDGEERLTGRGVSYCAVCDGAFFRGKEVVVVGGGDSAVEEGTYLTQFADQLTLIHRRDQLKAQDILQERAFKQDKMNFIMQTEVVAIEGDQQVESLRLHHLDRDEYSDLQADGVFVYIGHTPNTALVKDLGICDSEGWIMTDRRMQTSQAGIFAVGDVRQTPLRQVSTAVGDGSIAGHEAYNYIQSLN